MTTFLLALLSGTALWLAFPPVGWWWLAWLAPWGWLRLIRYKQLPGQRPLRALYLASVVHWMLLTHWVRLPHWSAGIGWFFLAGYLALFVPLFIVAARVMVHQWKWSPIPAAAIAWTGCELLRSRLFTGYALSGLGHTQVDWPALLQVASCCGAYGVSFLVMLVAAAIEQVVAYFIQRSRSTRGSETSANIFVNHSQAQAWWPVATSVGLLLAAVAHGHSVIANDDQLTSEAPRVRVVAATNFELRHHIGEANRDSTAAESGGTAEVLREVLPSEVLRVALIQGKLDTVFGGDPKRIDEAFEDYITTSRQAIGERQVDLVVWPESMFSSHWPIVTFESSLSGPEQSPPVPNSIRDEFAQLAQREGYSYRDIVTLFARKAQNKAFAVTSELGCPVVGGTEWIDLHGDTEDRYNAAVLFRLDGSVETHYRKMHPVMFGEYVPLGDVFPWLYKLTPMSSGLACGIQPVSMEQRGVRLSPSICFENTVPHLIRSQVVRLAADSQTPDALLTLTNDGWFWGSSLLDVHLACGIFRAVENRRPMLIAANTGFSAVIDAHGRLLARGPRRDSGYVIAEVRSAPPDLTIYTTWGDVFGGGCAFVALLALATGLQRRRSGIADA